MPDVLLRHILLLSARILMILGSTTIILILQLGKLSHKKVKKLAKDFESNILDPDLTLFTGIFSFLGRHNRYSSLYLSLIT